MKAALGFRVHSGWAALVALGGGSESPTILSRQRVELVDATAEGGNQPYHAAQGLELTAASRLLERSRKRICARAEAELKKAVLALESSGSRVRSCGVLVASGKIPDAVEKILASHPLLHAAEGALYRDALAEGAARLGLKVTRVPEKEIVAEHARRLRLQPTSVEKTLKGFKKEVGPPFRQDERLAALVAWLCLAGG